MTTALRTVKPVRDRTQRCGICSRASAATPCARCEALVESWRGNPLAVPRVPLARKRPKVATKRQRPAAAREAGKPRLYRRCGACGDRFFAGFIGQQGKARSKCNACFTGYGRRRIATGV